MMCEKCLERGGYSMIGHPSLSGRRIRLGHSAGVICGILLA